MNTFFIGDLHFCHANVLQFDNRPFKTIQEHDLALVRNWNSIVKPNDRVYILGDLSLSNPKHFFDYVIQLNGYKILISGNHDKMAYKNRYRQMGIIDVLYEAKMKIANQNCILCHFPYRYPWYRHLWNKYIKRRTPRHHEKRPIDRGNFLIHGHSHSRTQFNGRMINVGCQAWNYKPVPIQTIENYINVYIEKQRKK